MHSGAHLKNKENTVMLTLSNSKISIKGGNRISVN